MKLQKIHKKSKKVALVGTQGTDLCSVDPNTENKATEKSKKIEKN